MAFNYANQASVGKVANVDIRKDRNDDGSSYFSGIAEIKDVSQDDVTIQWVQVHPGRADVYYGPEMYTEAQVVSRDSITKYANEQSLDYTTVQNMRSQSILRDKGVFNAYQKQRNEKRVAMADALQPEKSDRQSSLESMFL